MNLVIRLHYQRLNREKLKFSLIKNLKSQRVDEKNAKELIPNLRVVHTTNSCSHEENSMIFLKLSTKFLLYKFSIKVEIFVSFIQNKSCELGPVFSKQINEFTRH